jgi:hypothetical protein
MKENQIKLQKTHSEKKKSHSLKICMNQGAVLDFIRTREILHFHFFTWGSEFLFARQVTFSSLNSKIFAAYVFIDV